MNYLKTVAEAGVKNMEMEALVFGALTHMAGIRSAVVCVTLLDRLKGDQVTSNAQWETWGGHLLFKCTYSSFSYCRSRHPRRSSWHGRPDQWRWSLSKSHFPSIITTTVLRYILAQLSVEEKNASMPAITKLARSPLRPETGIFSLKL